MSGGDGGDRPELCGFLRKSKAVGWDTRWFELSGSRLRYLEERGCLDLAAGATAAPAKDDPCVLRLEGAVSCRDGRSSVRPLKLRAPSAEVRDLWVSAITAAARSRSPTVRQPAATPAGASVAALPATALTSDETCHRRTLELERSEALYEFALHFARRPERRKAVDFFDLPASASAEFADPSASMGAGSMSSSVPRLTGGSAAAALTDAIVGNNWQVGKVLGEGQFGVVRMAIMPGGNILAVKQAEAADLFQEGDDGADARDAYRKEVAVMSQLSHPNVVKYHGTSVADGMLSLFMEYVPGGSLGELARTLDRPLEEQVVAGYGRQILAGLKYLHEHYIIHRDVKGDNILIDPSEGLVKLTDFGSAKKLQQSMVKGMSVAGTPNWMAPEVITQGDNAEGSYTFKVDVWSFGCTVIELLSEGQPPWSRFATPWACIFHIANSTGEPEGIPDSASATCRAFLSRCFRRIPDERPVVAELMEDVFILQAPDAVDASALRVQDVVGVEDAVSWINSGPSGKVDSPDA